MVEQQKQIIKLKQHKKYKDQIKTHPEHKAVQKLRVFLTFPVTTCVLALPSDITIPPRVSITYEEEISLQQIQ